MKNDELWYLNGISFYNFFFLNLVLLFF